MQDVARLSDINPSKQPKLTRVLSMEDMLEELPLLNLTGSIIKKRRIAYGGYSDVYTGIRRPSAEGEPELDVAIKELRIHLAKEQEPFVKVAIFICRPSTSHSPFRPSLEKLSPGQHFAIKISYD